jgi:hypothetical protein
MSGRTSRKAEPAIARTSMVSVYDGRSCMGFVLARGRTGFEAFDVNELSKGLFPTQQEAAAALSEDRAIEKERAS